MSENFDEQSQELSFADIRVCPKSPSPKVASKPVEDREEPIPKKVEGESKFPMPSLKLIVDHKPHPQKEKLLVNK